MRTTLQESAPLFLEEWVTDLNDKTPSQISRSSAYKAWWECITCQYQWQASVNARATGRGCPRCAGNQVIVGVNDISTTNPEYLDWLVDVDQATKISRGSRAKIEWQCPNGHIFTRKVSLFKMVCPLCIQKPLSEIKPLLTQEWSENNTKTTSEVSYNSAQVFEWICKKCKHQWVTPVYQRANGSGCPLCAFNNNSSQAEHQLNDHFKSLGLTPQRHARSVIDGELDFYFPEQQIAVEYNGLYWHSEAQGKTKQYHYNKWKACQDAGIQLITVWEDDYKRNPELVKSMLTYKLKMGQNKGIYARKTQVKRLNYAEASAFLVQYHIQGKVQGSYYLGLEDVTGELKAVSVWTKRDRTLHLERYSSSGVTGGLGKLLQAVLRLVEGQIDKVLTFASHDVSDGNLYDLLGFKIDGYIPPDYSYLVKGKREHKFNYRLKKFKSDPSLEWVVGFSETQLAKLNNLHRIWDTGKTRYVLDIK